MKSIVKPQKIEMCMMPGYHSRLRVNFRWAAMSNAAVLKNPASRGRHGPSSGSALPIRHIRERFHRPYAIATVAISIVV